MSATQQGSIGSVGSPAGGCRFVVALKPEADPVIDHFEMRPVEPGGPFRCWSDKAGDHWLVVTGIGKTSAAAGVAWLQAVSGADPAAVWINAGIAGHALLAPGKIRRIHKITDAGSDRSWYPSQVVGGDCGIESAGLLTVDRPATEFPDECRLVDMEASGFIETASRFTTLEFIHCLKVVSDNAESGFEDLKGNSNRIRGLMSNLVAALSESGFFEALEDASVAEAFRLADPPEMAAVLERIHFTETQRHQLRRLLQRVRALEMGADLIQPDLPNARAVLRALEDSLSGRVPI